MFRVKDVEEIKTHILCWTTFFYFRKSCCLWDNAENFAEPDRPQMTIWCTLPP